MSALDEMWRTYEEAQRDASTSAVAYARAVDDGKDDALDGLLRYVVDCGRAVLVARAAWQAAYKAKKESVDRLTPEEVAS